MTKVKRAIHEPWHTKGYLKLAHIWAYVLLELLRGNKTEQDVKDAATILRKCGIALKRETEAKGQIQ